jgi:hypothetical protein
MITASTTITIIRITTLAVMTMTITTLAVMTMTITTLAVMTMTITTMTSIHKKLNGAKITQSITRA